MPRLLLPASAAVALLLAFAPSHAKNPQAEDAEGVDPLSPSIQYGVCVSCHGAHGEGRPELASPRIGDLDATYVEGQLKAYRDGQRGVHPDERGAAVMAQVARGLPSNEVISELAAYIADMNPQHESAGEPVEGGEEAYATCGGCHGADAAGVPGLGPGLLFQQSDYLALQLRKYRDGYRGGPSAAPLAQTMAGFTAGLDDATIDRIVAHIASLRPERPPLNNPEVTLTTREGLKAFEDIYTVSTHPRCMNCHPEGDAPLQTDDSVPHTLGITRFSPLGGVHCRTCHSAVGVDDGLAPLPPADPIWSIAPKRMVFQNRTPAQLCNQLKDPEVNGGRGFTELAKHVEEDHLLITSWHSGRTPPPISHEELVKRYQTWGAAGGPCPEE